MSGLQGLDTLLNSLRDEGVPIDPPEVSRLHHAFRLSPQFDAEELRALLRCTLIKRAEHREVFERNYQDWLELARLEANLPAQEIWYDKKSTRSTRTPPIAPERKEVGAANRWRWLIGATALLVFLVLFGIAVWNRYFQLMELDFPAPFRRTADWTEPPVQTAIERADFIIPVAEYRTWVPRIDITPPGFENYAARVLGAALPALIPWLLGGGLWWHLKRRLALPPPAPSPLKGGPRWFPLFSAPDSVHHGLLEDEQRRNLIWGIGRFVSDELTHRIDLDRTVSDTARAAGIVHVCRQLAVYPREVWLWRDLMCVDNTLWDLSEEIAASLRHVGLPVRSGIFQDIPERVQWEEGEVFDPRVLEGHRQHAVVCVLTGGEGLLLAHSAAHRAPALKRLLQSLKDWPRLVFVDFGRGKQAIGNILRPFGIPCLEPEALVDYLGAEEVRSRVSNPRSRILHGDWKVFAACLALAPEPVPDDVAQRLRQHLRLELSGFALQTVHGSPGALIRDKRLDWTPPRRAELLNWLVAIDAARPTTWQGESRLLRPALEFWLEQCRQRASDHEGRENREGSLHLFSNTEAELRLRIDTALLELWLQPEEAVEQLYSLWLLPELKARVGREIGRFTTSDRVSTTRDSDHSLIGLPWSWNSLSLRAKEMLGRMGFGGKGISMAKRRLSGSSALAFGLCLGIGLATTFSSTNDLLSPWEPMIVHEGDKNNFFAKHMIADLSPAGLGSYRLVVGSPRRVRTVEPISAGSLVQIRWWPQDGLQDPDWGWHVFTSPERFGRSEIWRAGTVPQPIRAGEEGWPRRSLVVIEAELGSDPKLDDIRAHDARKLAATLLDRGSADVALIGPDWSDHLDRLIEIDPSLTHKDQLLILVPSGAAKSRAQISFQGRYSMISADLSPVLRVLESDSRAPANSMVPSILAFSEALRGRGAVIVEAASGALLRTAPAETEDKTSGIRFVSVTGGTFMMGSETSESDSDEHPAHAVSVGDFEMAVTETTRLQYSRAMGSPEPAAAEGDLPQVVIDWNDARAMCRKVGGRLPSEAEWEYAARAGSATDWPTGATPEGLDRYAWFGELPRSQAYAVAGKEPNALGLFDLHGNVWEWVYDAYDGGVYAGRFNRLTIDPINDGPASASRLLRGGAWLDDPGFLRSSLRGRLDPELRSGLIGFRCVRAVGRQN